MKKSIKTITFILLALIASGISSSCCHSDDDDQPEAAPQFTYLIFQPTTYGGNPDLTPFMKQDLREVDEAVRNGLAKTANVIVFQGDINKSKLYQKQLSKTREGKDTVVNVMLKEYPVTETDYTSFSGLKRILSDVIVAGKTEQIGMSIGCHADGWIPTNEDRSSRAPSVMKKSYGQGYHGDYDTAYKTLGKAIEATGKKFEFIHLDNCYSQNIEVAYDLRNACKTLLASVTEIGSDGLDYKTNVPLLVKGDYQTVCQNYLKYYQSAEQWPSAALSAIDCSYMDELAALMKSINTGKTNPVDRSALQVFDGYDENFSYHFNIFYDFGDYVSHYCADETLLSQFNTLLYKMVIANTHTPSFTSVYFHSQISDGKFVPKTRDIKTCSGITCSDPCSELFYQWKETSWYAATH